MPNSTRASRIAVIIPVYAAHYLGECLQSVFSQTLSPAQVTHHAYVRARGERVPLQGMA